MRKEELDSEVRRYSTSIKIDPKLWKEAKKAAIDADMKLSELVEEAIREWIEKRRGNNV
ncbi:hypothetical protein DRO97_00960 [Archaeoglobales archaeon]|nr:MAG: hypothetical protein DRO97_00960 [Archaeoglobales archaeon]